jgi:hypothetical protein
MYRRNQSAHYAERIATMKTVKMTYLPKCQFCEQMAKYDAPVKGGSAWGYMCPQCYSRYGRPGIGSELVLHEPTSVDPVNKGKHVQGDCAISNEDELFDSIFEVSCPLCGNSRTLEPDADGYMCRCGAHVTFDLTEVACHFFQES